MPRNLLIVGGSALAAVLIGSGLYLYYAETGLPNTELSMANPASSTDTTPEPSPSVSFRVLDSGTQATNAPARKNYAAYSKDGFEKLWTMAHGSSGAPIPEIDFSTEYAIGVFAGQRPTGGYAIEVASVTDEDVVRTVNVLLTKPGTNCMVTEAFTSPYQIIVVPLSAAALAHTDAEAAAPCN